MDDFGEDNLPHAARCSYRLTGADSLRFPVLVAVPHAARTYPAALTDNLRLPAAALVRLEDRYADLLARDVQKAGFAVIMAAAPRAWIDMNRAPDDIDAALLSDADASRFPQPSAKARGGLGLVPARLSGYGDLWRRQWNWRDIEARIAGHHTPYHAKIAQVLDAMERIYGGAVLLDLHSMPSLPVPQDGPVAQVVVGDRFARAAATRLSDMALGMVRDDGLHAALNHPYAGGYTLQRHGTPARNIHAIQIEFDRALYLDERQREPGSGMDRIAGLVARIARLLADEMTRHGYVQAAE